MSLRAVVTGCGHYLPARVVENAEFEATLDTNDEWIRSRSGIERRHFAAEGETTSTMASAAAAISIRLSWPSVSAISGATGWVRPARWAAKRSAVQTRPGMKIGVEITVILKKPGHHAGMRPHYD